MKFFSLCKPQTKEILKLSEVIIPWMLAGVMLFGVSLAWGGGGPNVTGAKLYIQQNDLEQAIRVLLKEIEEVNPRNEDAWYLLGYVYARQKKYDKMVEAFNKAVELKPKFKEKGIKISKDSGTQFYSIFGVDIILGIVWGNAVNTAVQYFNNAIETTSDSVRTDSFEKAIEYFKMATIIIPDSSIAYRNLAAALMNLGKYEESIEPLKKVLDLNPNDIESKTMLASVYVAIRNDSLALPMLEELWAEGHRTEEIADYLSKIYLLNDRVEEAKLIYIEALETNPDNYLFRYNYGTILLEAKEYDAAIEQFLKAYELDPESADLNYNLGASYLNRGVAKRDALPEDSEDRSYVEDFKLAMPYLEKAIKMNPDDEFIWMTLGKIAGQLNKIALAGYAFSKGEKTKSALDNKVVVGMESSTLKLILGEPDKITPLESEVFSGIEEWVYKKRRGAKGKVAIPEDINIYIKNGRVDALMVL